MRISGGAALQCPMNLVELDGFMSVQDQQAAAVKRIDGAVERRCSAAPTRGRDRGSSTR